MSHVFAAAPSTAAYVIVITVAIILLACACKILFTAETYDQCDGTIEKDDDEEERPRSGCRSCPPRRPIPSRMARPSSPAAQPARSVYDPYADLVNPANPLSPLSPISSLNEINSALERATEATCEPSSYRQSEPAAPSYTAEVDNSPPAYSEPSAPASVDSSPASADSSPTFDGSGSASGDW